MSKRKTERPAIKDKWKTIVAVAATVVLVVVNLLPLHHVSRHDCPGGGSYIESGRTMGVPFAYYETSTSDMSNCFGYVNDESSRGFSAQALLADGLVFGLVMIGINVLLDRRTMA